MTTNRREFLKTGFLTLAGAWIVTKLAWVSSAVASTFKTPPPPKAADPLKGQSKTNKYVHFASEYKGIKKPTFAADANCANCNFFKPDKPGDNWGKCAMIGNLYAYTDGMCQMWQKKPGA
jgi:hypothetical protein